jgi:hypothetical protein
MPTSMARTALTTQLMGALQKLQGTRNEGMPVDLQGAFANSADLPVMLEQVKMESKFMGLMSHKTGSTCRITCVFLISRAN